MRVFNIFEQNMESFEKKIKKLQRKADKIGNGTIGFKVVGESFKRIENATYKMIHVEITGAEAPRIDGWEFVATIIHQGEKNIINKIPTFENEIPNIYRTRNSICEHCNSNRYRKDTYILRNTMTNEFKQVGKSCLKDFLGHQNPNQIASYGEMLLEFHTEEWDSVNFDYRGSYTDLIEWVAMSVAIIDRYGYISKTKAQEETLEPTSEKVYNQIYYSHRISPSVDTTECDNKKAKKIIDYIKNIASKNNYEENLKILASEKCISQRFYGYATSMVAFYEKEMERINKEKQEVKSEYFGEEKEKVELTLTVNKVVVFDGYYGITKLHLMSDAEGRQFTWKTSTKSLEEGKTLNIKATIKEHMVYNGIKQTVLTRVKEV